MLNVRHLVKRLKEYDWRNLSDRDLLKPMGTPFPFYLESANSEKRTLSKIMREKGYQKCMPTVEMGHFWHDEDLTFDEAVDIAGYGKYHFMLLAACGLVVMICALDLFALAAFFSPIACKFHLQTEDIILLNGIHFCGAISGTILWGVLGDSFGRRGPLSIALFLYAFACILNVVPISYITYISSLFLLSFSIWGATNLAIVMLVEFQPRTSRGFAVAGLQIFWILGIVLMQGFAFLVTNKWASWVLLRLIPSLPAIALACSFHSFFPETPRFLYTREIMIEYNLVRKKLLRKCEKRMHSSGRCFVVIPNVNKKLANKELIEHTNKKISQNDTIDQQKEEAFDKRQYRSWVWIMREPKPVLTITSLRKVFKINNNKLESKREYPVTHFSDAAEKYEKQWKQYWMFSYILILLLNQFFLEHGIHTLALWFPDLINTFQAYCKLQGIEQWTKCVISKLYYKELMSLQQWCHDVNWGANNQAILHTLMVAFSPLPSISLMMLGIDRYGRKLFLVFSNVSFAIIAFGGYFLFTPDQDLIFSCVLQAIATISTTSSIIFTIELTKTRYRAFKLGLLIAFGRLGALFGILGYFTNIIPTCAFLIFLIGFSILGSGILVFIFPNTSTIFLRP